MVPFDMKKLNDLMGEASIAVLLASTRHNVRYLTGGYYFHFHAKATRIGRSQYLPFVGLPHGRFEDAFYVGRADESGQIEAEGLWPPHRFNTVRGTQSAAEGAIAAIRQFGLAGN